MKNDNGGVIFKNNFKEKESQPDYKGKCTIDGVEKEVALWVKKDKNGNSFFSAKFSEPYNPDNEQHAKAMERGQDIAKEMQKGLKEDDLPF